MPKTLLLISDALSVRETIHHAVRQHDLEWSMHSAPTAGLGREILKANPVDAIILDMWLPDGDGLQVLAELRRHAETIHTPVLMLAQRDDHVLLSRALELNATDFIGKPVDVTEIAFRLSSISQHLEASHRAEPAKAAPHISHDDHEQLRESRIEVVWRLSKASECRDQETGNHTLRVGYYASVIAKQLGLDREYQDKLLLAAMLHDIGKLGISDNILRKAGKLTEHETSVIRTHCEIGHTILKAQYKPPRCEELGIGFGEVRRSEFVDLAAVVALQHHERWDGTGYPYGLAGEEIDLAARITAVADVYDVLRSSRPYKPAFSEEKSIEQIQSDREKAFDPDVVDAFMTCLPTIRKISFELLDGDDVLTKRAA